MAAIIESRPCPGGTEITRLVSTDRDIVVPDTVDGLSVVSLGSRFLSGSPGTDSRTVTVPSSVVRMSEDAFSGMAGLREIRYLGDFDVFNESRVTAEHDCRVVSSHDGHVMSFDFPRGFRMSFPDFDETMASSGFRLTPEIAMKRLSDPYRLEESGREMYGGYMRGRMMPIAEHAVSSGDIASLESAESTGLISDSDLRVLLSMSLRSGKTAVTSVIMSKIRSRMSK